MSVPDTTAPVFTVDLGGTWLRIRSGEHVDTLASPSVLRRPGEPVERLLGELIDTLSQRVPANAVVNIACGAALDETASVAHGSGPLWGDSRATPLRAMLEERRPDVQWTLVNDVTAGLASYVRSRARSTDRHVAYMTISSGIALRTAYLTEGVVPVDALGLQGEVGHLRAVSSAPERVRELRCGCGGFGHVASLSSGPGIDAVADALGIAYAPSTFTSDVARGHPQAKRLLTIVVEPIAELVRAMLALDPRLDRIGIGGGVAEGLHEYYECELLTALSQKRSYADVSLTPGRLRDTIDVCRPGTIDTLAGADDIANGYLRVTTR